MWLGFCENHIIYLTISLGWLAQPFDIPAISAALLTKLG